MIEGVGEDSGESEGREGQKRLGCWLLGVAGGTIARSLWP